MSMRPRRASLPSRGLAAALLIPPALLCLFPPPSHLVGAAPFRGGAPAFVPPPPSSAQRSAATSAPSSRFERSAVDEGGRDGLRDGAFGFCDGDGAVGSEEGITRRGLLRSAASLGGGGLLGAAAAALARPSPARAAATATASSAAARRSLPSAVASAALCDPSVSTWVKTYGADAGGAADGNAAMRTVHLLGTAHISSSSAELAGRMVRDLKPDVVFVELDAKRVGRAMPGPGDVQASGSVAAGAGGAGSVGGSPGGGEAVATATSGAITSTPTGATSDAPPKSNPFDVRSKMVNAGSKYVGNAVKSMYGKLESEGFKAGDEFAMSVKEGLAIGSTIVLGDRDVEVTLRRLTQALAKTDIRKLLSADSDLNASMEELLPEGMKNQMKQSSGGGGGGSNSMSVPSAGMGEVEVNKEEFQTFVETMKAKENVKKIMALLQSTAPEIYEAMVAERDAYMGRGLDELGVNVAGRSDSTVAVMGMAHVDGVERYLASRGWKEMTYPCPVAR